MIALIAMSWCFTAILAVAGVAKLGRPTTLEQLLHRLPHARVAVWALGLVEVAAATATFVGARGGLVAAGVIYLGLAFGAEYLLRSGTQGSCGCLGSAKSRLSVGHVLFNLAGGIACLPVALAKLPAAAPTPLNVGHGVITWLIIAQVTGATWLCINLFEHAGSTWNAWNNPWWGAPRAPHSDLEVV